MKLIGFIKDGEAALGAVLPDEQVVDLREVRADAPTDLGSYLRSGRALVDLKGLADRAACAAVQRIHLDDIEFGLPVATPGSIFCLGLNYQDHIQEGSYKDSASEYPAIFLRGVASLVAHGRPILRPHCSDKLDYEAELVAIIGKTVRNATIAQALDAVVGYACFNDATIRDYQKRTSQWTMGKNFDNTGAFGPFFVSADELPPGAKGLKIETRLNGCLMQSSDTDHLIHSVADTIVSLTEGITLRPGDLVVTGTPSGVGYARTPPVFMRHGDVVEVAIEGVGVLRNPVCDEWAAEHVQAAE